MRRFNPQLVFRMVASMGVVAMALILAGPANASLTSFQTYNGNYGYTQDGCGSELTSSCTITLTVPSGSTVANAYLYSGLSNTNAAQTGTLNGNAVSYGAPVINNNFLAMQRADVTSIVSGVVGSGGTYTFTIGEGSTNVQDGEALVIVFQNAALPTATVGILDGFAATTGDTTAINFANPLHPGDPGFFAEMAIGDNYSCCAQTSTINVNGTIITNSAGNNDDSQDGATVANGNLITVGGPNTAFSTFLPSYADDHERYNLVPYITDGDTSIHVTTNNPTNDDNIFLATFYVSGLGGVNAPPPDVPPTSTPEPSSISMLGSGLIGLAFAAKRMLAKA